MTTTKAFDLRQVILAVAVTCLALMMFSTPLHHASAETDVSQNQASLIEKLMKQIEELKAQLAELQGVSETDAPLPVPVIDPPEPDPSWCHKFKRSLYLGARDSNTDGEVSKLQEFLKGTGDYTYGSITGYFGPLTQEAVRKWQARNGVVSYGTPDSTGYGLVGTLTRAKLNSNCISPIDPPEPSDDPYVDLKINGSDGPIRLTPGHAEFSWKVSNKLYDTCSANGDTYWTGNKDPRGDEKVWIGNEKTGKTVYTISCNSSNSRIKSISDSVVVTFVYGDPEPEPPTVDLKINGSDGPIMLSPGEAKFEWKMNNDIYDRCDASSDSEHWTGSKKPYGSEEVFVENLNSGAQTYTIDCHSSNNRIKSISDSVIVTIIYGDPEPQGECYIGGCSSQLCSDQPGVSSTCEWKDEYACYKTATCERQTNGECGWTPTDELKQCLVGKDTTPGTALEAASVVPAKSYVRGISDSKDDISSLTDGVERLIYSLKEFISSR